MEQIYGYIERITFQNPENGYSVIQVQQPDLHELTCVVGILPTVQPGETVRFYGQWKRHLIHGNQFCAERYQTEAPADIEGIKKYLGSGMIKGIGKVYANKIVDQFGTETLAIIESNPGRLLDIQGLGPKRLDLIKQCWDEQKTVREVMIFLQGHGVSPTFARKIFKRYGAGSIKVVQENPYCLARDIHGIGFKSADKIAAAIGISKDSPERADAGIEFALSELSGDGHVCYPKVEFVEMTSQMLDIAETPILERLSLLNEKGRVVLEDLAMEGKMRTFVWLKAFYVSEVGIAREINRLLNSLCNLREIDTGRAVAWAQQQLQIELASNQKAAVICALKDKMGIITGGPGTGKSTITNAILRITEKLSPNILLAAPTGRAAKRMTEITGKKAKTIHSLLEFDFKKMGFKRDRKNPLECDLIIIDEASMIDTVLMYCLLKAVPNHARVIFVGDIDQLPSVGAGNVLRDIIQSKVITVTMLNEIFRQAKGSRIITNAHKINRGHFPETQNVSNSDFFFINCQEPDAVLSNIIALVSQRLPKKYGFDPVTDIQVLAPMRKGIIGTQNLNTALQEALNSRDSCIYRAGYKFQVGDKVMQIRNNYDKEVFNGDVGKIVKIDQVDQIVIVEIDQRHIAYDFNDLDELILAYAVSIHKYQGSECPCVVIPIHTCHFKLLHRNLIYTGVTRGKKLVVMVGTLKALAIAVKNDEVKRRYTGLKEALIGSKAKQSYHLMEF